MKKHIAAPAYYFCNFEVICYICEIIPSQQDEDVNFYLINILFLTL